MDLISRQQIELNKREKARKKAERMRKWKLMLVGAMFTLGLAALFGRVIYIKTVHGEEYEKRAAEQELSRSRTETVIPPNEGNILTRNKQSLASSYAVYNIILDPNNLSKLELKDQTETLNNLSKFLDEPIETLNGYMTKDAEGNLSKYQIVKKDVSQEVTDQLLNSGVLCVYTEKVSKRTYPHGSLAAQVIGFVRGDTRWGLEESYEEQIAGIPGKTFRTYDSENNTIIQKKEPIDGYSIVTTLDLTIQQYAEEIAKKAGEEYRSQKSSVIVMNPKTGEILGMAEYPTFDLNDPVNYGLVQGSVFKEELNALPDNEKLNKMNGVWGNYNISKSIEPGSIYKPFVVAAALEENVIGYNDSYLCEGEKTIIDTRIPCWFEPGHGTQSLTAAMAHSCNMALIDIGLKLGKDRYYKYQHDFGFGEKTGIDLSGELSKYGSLVYSLSKLNPVEIATGSMGQGFNCTPIQAINGFGALINGGNLMRPYVVSQVIDSNNNIIEENNPYVVRKVISQETSNYIRTALAQVVSADGTGKKAVIEGYSIGGKTGTAQQTVSRKEHAVSFIAYLPVEDPEIIAMVLIDRPEEYVDGDTTATVSMRELLIKIINYKGIKPSGEVNEDLTGIDGNTLVLDDYKGQGLNEVTKGLNEIGLEYMIVGNGDTVNSQMPVAGSKVSTDTVIKLYLTVTGSEEELVTVPDVVGMPPDQAALAFEGDGLSFRVFEDRKAAGETPDNEAVPGITATNEGTETGTGEESAETSDDGTVRGQGQSSQTDNTGDAAQNSDETGAKVVYEQSPEGGAKVSAGTEIRLKVKSAD